MSDQVKAVRCLYTSTSGSARRCILPVGHSGWHNTGEQPAVPAREPEAAPLNEPKSHLSEMTARSWASGVQEPHRTAGITIGWLRARIFQLEQQLLEKENKNG